MKQTRRWATMRTWNASRGSERIKTRSHSRFVSGIEKVNHFAPARNNKTEHKTKSRQREERVWNGRKMHNESDIANDR